MVHNIMAKAWQDWEIQLIRDKYPTCATNIPELSHRSAQQIMAKAHRIGVRNRGKRKIWTPEEIKLLTENWDGKDTAIPGLDRSYQEMAHKASALGLRVRNGAFYTDEEDEAIRKAYESGMEPELSGRSQLSIQARARKLGLKKAEWTREETELIKSRYADLGAAGLHEIMPRRTVTAITVRANLLGLCYSQNSKERTADMKRIGSLQEGWRFAKCRVCQKWFMVVPGKYREFSHATHGNKSIPKGWILPRHRE